MKNIIKDQTGVTLIETVVSTAIIAIILVTVLGALLFGQKMVVFSDSKNNEAAQAQEMVDEIMKQLSARADQSDPTIAGATKVNGVFFTPSQPAYSRKQYYYEPVDIVGNKVTVENAIGYRVYVRVYYNNDQSYVELDAFTKKGSVFQ
ncbi:MAG: type II secretion system protein [Acetobacterium sp.]|uniref:PulJ/GspJ family protein n=1 Tax=Acetobacterium sp. TaxID=1872094 RepID=UPI003242CE3E